MILCTFFAIRSYATPPAMVMNVMSSVCVLLKQPTDWNAIRHIMVDPVGFLRHLTSLDKNNVSDKVSLLDAVHLPS